MGSSASRPRPGYNDSDAPQPFPPQHNGPPAIGPYFFRQSHQQRPGPYNPVFYPPPNPAMNNGQFHGGYSPRPQPYPGAVSVPADKSLQQTETIRNAVNVKKDRIMLIPMEGSTSKLSVHFEFDASSPCLVTIFICGREFVGSEDACRISSAKQPAISGGHYDKGIGLKFPRSEGSAATAVIDLSRYREEELRTVSDDGQWPLIIRLECMSEQGLQQGHSLSELVPGGPQKVWVQSQTTFATLTKNDEGNWVTDKMKQKIMVNGISYELQSIYGMDQNDKKNQGRATPVQTAEAEEERLCVICLVNDRNTTVLPCRHMCMCHECAQELRKQTSKCPICREHVESLLYIKMKQAPKNAATPVDQSTVAAALEKLGIKDDKREPAATSK